MKILVVGGTGHIGSYLVPRLVLGGHEVTVVARNPKPQYGDARVGWGGVNWIVADRRAEEKDGTWLRRMEGLDADAVADLICYSPDQNALMVKAFAGRARHFLHCGTIWVYGAPRRKPCDETHPRQPLGSYGRNKAAIEADLIERWRSSGFPATVIHPGHISGRYWLPIDPQGTRNGLGVYEKLARGQTVHLPGDGLATIHHVHADDVAQQFELAILNREASLGQSFNAVAPHALTLAGCCEFVASLFGRKPELAFVPLAELKGILGESAWDAVVEHVKHSPCCSIEKARRRLGYAPRYTTEQIYRECVEHWVESGQLRPE